jgi:hypothetical protein
MPSAARLLAAAARVLPAADREPYAQEYRSELWELAQAGDGRVGQLCYALRQVRKAPRWASRCAHRDAGTQHREERPQTRSPVSSRNAARSLPGSTCQRLPREFSSPSSC